MFPLYAFQREATLNMLFQLYIKISPRATQPLDLLPQPEEWSSRDLSRPLKDNTKGPLNSLIWNYTNSTPCQLTHTERDECARNVTYISMCQVKSKMEQWNWRGDLHMNQTFVCPNYRFMSLTLSLTFSSHKGDCSLPVEYECGPCDSILVWVVTWT